MAAAVRAAHWQPVATATRPYPWLLLAERGGERHGWLARGWLGRPGARQVERGEHA